MWTNEDVSDLYRKDCVTTFDSTLFFLNFLLPSVNAFNVAFYIVNFMQI